ncbi:MAG: PhzF family phenazine biosynthesis protein [Acidimicrobiia bacterium]|nr:MAG: PhzF family phenazine biosynthesis protein [Acidimicrobiia bacterium]
MRHCYVLRVFTRGEEGGNPLGVVTDLTGLDAAGMQRIASELAFSETVFIDWQEEGTPSVRIFTPRVEIPFAGHPLVGAAWVLSMMGPGTVDKVTCGIGEVPFRVDGEAVWVDVPLPDAVRRAPEAESIALMSRLPDPMAAWWVELPLEYLVIDPGFPSLIEGADPDFDALEASGAGLCYLAAPDRDGYRARFFAPAVGVPEDAATGSAAVALAAVRHFEGERQGRCEVWQGEEIGSPSTILLSWDGGTASLGGTVSRDEVRILDI